MARQVSVPEGFSPWNEGGPFIDLIGPVYVKGDGEDRAFGLRIEEKHLNVAGAAQGGVLATLADHSLGQAIRAGRDDDEQSATVSLTTDYLGPAKAEDWVESTTTVERVAERMAFADCSLKVDGREIVRARAVFAVVS